MHSSALSVRASAQSSPSPTCLAFSSRSFDSSASARYAKSHLLKSSLHPARSAASPSADRVAARCSVSSTSAIAFAALAMSAAIASTHAWVFTRDCPSTRT